MKTHSIASFIDHTLLKPESTQEEIITLCEEAKAYNFKTVCVNPYWVKLAKETLKNSSVGITTVIGFPLGASTTFVKVAETHDAISSGATEIDMVMNIGELKSHNNEGVQADIQAVVDAAHKKAIVKVIIETGLLTKEEKIKACELSKDAGADYVKTSTGFGPGGATEADIKLMRDTVGAKIGVKASGGVRDLETAELLLKAGATRLGASSGIAIVSEEDEVGH